MSGYTNSVIASDVNGINLITFDAHYKCEGICRQRHSSKVSAKQEKRIPSRAEKFLSWGYLQVLPKVGSQYVFYIKSMLKKLMLRI